MSDPREALEAVRGEISKAVIGQDRVIGGVFAGLLLGGHVILEGVPGVAKTLLVKSLGRSLGLAFSRIQFTPDLMPSDVTGNLVYESGSRDFRFRPGPIFANLVLADELNRTPPKTQAALLEAMEERQVSVEGEGRRLPDPFMVLATQNPIEYEGTYPLPEAELDRFLLKLVVGYPEHAAERDVLRMHDRGVDPHDLDALGVRVVAGADDVAAGSAAINEVRVTDEIVGYIMALADETRTSPSLVLGVSPRGSAMLLRTSKAAAWLAGRDFVTPDDVKALLGPTWGHRLILRPEVELEGGTSDSILGGLADRVPVPG